MIYKNIKKAEFLSRPNRFIAEVMYGGEKITAHVKNTGRCRELLIPGAEVYLEFSENPERKTPCDLVCVKKGDRLINMDSQVPNMVYEEYILPRVDFSKREVKYKNSIFDFYSEKCGIKTFTEVKGVTLEKEGVCLFPDAPTMRGIKHLSELSDCIKNGFNAEIVFVIQMENVKYFTPNKITHPEFADALKSAYDSGVKIRAFDCKVTENTLKINNPVKVVL